jgi:hypothetical protein
MVGALAVGYRTALVSWALEEVGQGSFNVQCKPLHATEFANEHRVYCFIIKFQLPVLPREGCRS